MSIPPSRPDQAAEGMQNSTFISAIPYHMKDRVMKAWNDAKVKGEHHSVARGKAAQVVVDLGGFNATPAITNAILARRAAAPLPPAPENAANLAQMETDARKNALEAATQRNLYPPRTTAGRRRRKKSAKRKSVRRRRV